MDRIEGIRKSVIKSIIDCLEPFREATKVASQSNKPSLYFVWPWAIKLQKHLQSSLTDTVLISQMKKAGLDYFKKNFQPQKHHKAAVFLNPTLKSLKWCNQNEIRAVTNYISNLMTENSDDESSSSSSSAQIPANYSSLVDFIDESEFSSNQESELQSYINCKVMSTENFDVLAWWNNNREAYPKLYKLALFFHSIPATSTPSERNFSTAGNVITEKRSCLSPETVDNILFLNSNQDIYDYLNN